MKKNVLGLACNYPKVCKTMNMSLEELFRLGFMTSYNMNVSWFKIGAQREFSKRNPIAIEI